MMTTIKFYLLLLIAFFLVAYILPLGSRSLTIPDETRYAEIPREMIASGDWVVPRLNNVRYFEKPVLGYWLHAGSIMLLGENNFAVRFPSAAGVGLAAWLIFVMARRGRRDGDEAPASLTTTMAALIFLSCGEVFALGNTAVLDTLFALFLTASIVAFYFATEEHPGSAKERLFLLLAGAACGLAFLTKGFLAFAIVGLSVVPYLIWQRRAFDLLRMCWLPALSALAVALPWCVMIHLKEPDYWRYFFWNEHIRRFMSSDAQHKESFWFFFLTAPGMFLPWTFVLPAAVPGIKAQLSEKDANGRMLRFCVCWLIVPFVFLSLSRGKLLTYILPCFPPFAILMAAGLTYILSKNSRDKLFQGGTAAWAAIVSLALLGFLGLQLFGADGLKLFHAPWQVILVVNGLTCLILFCVWSFQSKQVKNKLLLFGLAPLLGFFVIHYTIPEVVSDNKSPGPFLEQYLERIAIDDIIITDKNSVGAVCWYLKRSDLYVFGMAGELDYGFDCEKERHRLLDPPAVGDLISRHPGKTIVISRPKDVSRKRWKGQFPSPAYQDESSPTGYLLWKY